MEFPHTFNRTLLKQGHQKLMLWREPRALEIVTVIRQMRAESFSISSSEAGLLNGKSRLNA